MRRFTKGSTLVVVLVLIAVAGPLAPSASAIVTETKLTIRTTVPLYHGKVRSAFEECTRHRRVVLFRVRKGPDRRIGYDRSSKKGTWRVPAPANLSPGDRFYARTLGKEVSSVGTGLSCAGDRSRTVTFVGD